MSIYVNSKEQDSFIGTIHPKHSHISVIGWDGISKRQTQKLYDVYCSKCAKDFELHGNGIFKQTKYEFIKGQSVCGCVKNYRWSEQQSITRIKRK